MIEVRFDASAFIAWLRRADDTFQASARQALGQAVEVALSAARGTQAFKDRTGALRKSIVRGQKSTWKHFIKATAPYAAYVEYGTRPHPIEARRRRVLRFVQAGEVKFRRRVRHPGTKPRPFMQFAADVGDAALRDLLERAADRSFR